MNNKENVEYLHNKFKRIISQLDKLDSSILIDELISAQDDFKDYVNREDYVIWSQEAENIVCNIYYAIRNEVLKRMK